MFVLHPLDSEHPEVGTLAFKRSIGTCLAMGASTLFASCKATRSTQRGARLLHEGRADECGAQVVVSR